MFGKQPRNTFKIPSLQDIKDIGGFVKDYGSEVGSIVSETSKDMGSIIKKHANEKSLIKRQNIIKENAIQHQAEHERWLADRADGMPRDWGTALKDAGGGSGAAWRVGANAVAGGVAGGVVDGSMGNDSWSDGAMTGAALGGILGAGSFAHSVNKLKVGKYTPVVNGGVTEVSKNVNPSAVQKRPSERVVSEMEKRSGKVKPNFTTVGDPY